MTAANTAPATVATCRRMARKPTGQSLVMIVPSVLLWSLAQIRPSLLPEGLLFQSRRTILAYGQNRAAESDRPAVISIGKEEALERMRCAA